MTKRLSSLAALAGLLALLSGCAPRAVVFLNSHYDAAKIQKMALIEVEDYPSAAGSGRIVAGIFEKYLLLGGYSLAERRQVEAVMEKQSISPSGSMDLPDMQAMGKLLGVDALAFGQITDFHDSSDHTVVVDMPLEQSTPIFGTVVTTAHDHGTHIRTEQQVVTGYSTTTTDVPVQQVQTVDAHVGLTIRVVNVQTGELLWSASASADGAHLNDATERVSSELMRGVVSRLKQAIESGK